MKRMMVLVSCLSAAVIMVSVSSAAGGPPGTFTLREDARGIAYTSENIKIEAGKNVVIQSLTLEPGWTSGWHEHPDDALVLVKKGKLTQYLDCDEKIVWAGSTRFPLAAGEHSTHADHQGPQLAKNEGSEAVDITIIFPNVPPGQTPGLIPRDFQPPPAECPTLN